MDNNILDIFKKHIGDIGGINTNKQDFSTTLNATYMKNACVKQFSEDMKGANEFIGALQKLDISLKKIAKLLSENMYSDANSDTLGEEIKLMSQNCTFMNVALFDSELALSTQEREFKITIESPKLNSDYIGALDKINSQRNQIAELLSEINNEMLNKEIFKTSKTKANIYTK